ncbi:MAG: hypothetical protein HZY76_05925 [Anaerolineae bacterium]|nr:MAG: hypothetical protein HZY76_05925 [Anaerolineae bacterium]
MKEPRNEFYKLSRECREYARRLATFDQRQVDRQVCHEFNQFLTRARIRPAAGHGGEDRTARPLTRVPWY